MKTTLSANGNLHTDQSEQYDRIKSESILYFHPIYQSAMCVLAHMKILNSNPDGVIIRIYHECKGRIETFVPRITVRHHDACRVMTNGDPEGQIFLSYPHTNNGFFFLLPTVFVCLFINFKISFQKSLNALRCNFTWWRYLTSWVR